MPPTGVFLCTSSLPCIGSFLVTDNNCVLLLIETERERLWVQQRSQEEDVATTTTYGQDRRGTGKASPTSSIASRNKTTLLLNLWQSFAEHTHTRTRYYYLPAMVFLLLLIATLASSSSSSSDHHHDHHHPQPTIRASSSSASDWIYWFGRCRQDVKICNSLLLARSRSSSIIIIGPSDEDVPPSCTATKKKMENKKKQY